MALELNAHAAAEAHRPAAEPAGAPSLVTRCEKTSFGKFAIWCRKPSHGSPPASLAIPKATPSVAPWLAGGQGRLVCDWEAIPKSRAAGAFRLLGRRPSAAAGRKASVAASDTTVAFSGLEAVLLSDLIGGASGILIAVPGSRTKSIASIERRRNGRSAESVAGLAKGRRRCLERRRTDYDGVGLVHDDDRRAGDHAFLPHETLRRMSRTISLASFTTPILAAEQPSAGFLSPSLDKRVCAVLVASA